MTHRFPIKEIARQAGLGSATVDRVLNARAHVSQQSRLRVNAAIEELAQQEQAIAARGRRLFFDFVIDAPDRFSREVQRAALHAADRISGAVCRSRFFKSEMMMADATVEILARIAKRGSDGVCLKVQNTPVIQRAVSTLTDAGIPVVTLVTDITDTQRLSYVGLDNQGAGRTAAYLVGQVLRDAVGCVLTTRSNGNFLGEQARERAFLDFLSTHHPSLRPVCIIGGSGRGRETAKLIAERAHELTDLTAVYSMGGGNRAILGVLDDFRLSPRIYVAHDLDVDNRSLIRNRSIDLIIHHDLTRDIFNVFNALLSHHKLAPKPTDVMMSVGQAVTAYNLPSGT